MLEIGLGVFPASGQIATVHYYPRLDLKHKLLTSTNIQACFHLTCSHNIYIQLITNSQKRNSFQFPPINPCTSGILKGWKATTLASSQFLQPLPNRRWILGIWGKGVGCLSTWHRHQQIPILNCLSHKEWSESLPEEESLQATLQFSMIFPSASFMKP